MYVELKRLKELEEFYGSLITYWVRLDPNVVPDAQWRECTLDEYLSAREDNHHGGLTQTKAIPTR